jgi:hypothetical protein
MVAPIAHQNGKAKSATKPNTLNVVQKTFRCISSILTHGAVLETRRNQAGNTFAFEKGISPP